MYSHSNTETHTHTQAYVRGAIIEREIDSAEVTIEWLSVKLSMPVWMHAYILPYSL